MLYHRLGSSPPQSHRQFCGAFPFKLCDKWLGKGHALSRRLSHTGRRSLATQGKDEDSQDEREEEELAVIEQQLAEHDPDYVGYVWYLTLSLLLLCYEFCGPVRWDSTV
jgi:hypothetical protein